MTSRTQFRRVYRWDHARVQRVGTIFIDVERDVSEDVPDVLVLDSDYFRKHVLELQPQQPHQYSR